MFIILIAISLFILVSYSLYKIENFEENEKSEQRFDKIFEKVDYYPNIYSTIPIKENIISELLSTGIDKCKKECSGSCVEFGITGNAYCFNPILKKYSRDFISHASK